MFSKEWYKWKRIEQKMKLAMKQKVYNKKLLETCKGCSDQCNKQEKLGKIVATKSDLLENRIDILQPQS